MLTLSCEDELTFHSAQINPGLPLVFPWLSAIAKRYEKYTFHKLKFCYVARCPTTRSGDVSMVCEFNSLQAAPSTFAQMTSYKGFINTPIWKEVDLTVAKRDMDSTAKERFTRASMIGGDLRLYDTLTFYAAVQGSTAAEARSSAGFIFCEYDVEFFIPQLSAMVPALTNRSWSARVSKQLLSEDVGTAGFTILPYAYEVETDGLGVQMGILDDSILLGTRPVVFPGGNTARPAEFLVLQKGRYEISCDLNVEVDVSGDGTSGAVHTWDGSLGFLCWGDQNLPLSGDPSNYRAENAIVSGFQSMISQLPASMYTPQLQGSGHMIYEVLTDPVMPRDLLHVNGAEFKALAANAFSAYLFNQNIPNWWSSASGIAAAVWGHRGGMAGNRISIRLLA